MYPLICVDCRWCLPTQASSQGVYYCKASERRNLVTGEPEYTFCNVMRLAGQPCDIDGKLFSLNIPDQEGANHGE
jgi:hypothetical protein